MGTFHGRDIVLLVYVAYVDMTMSGHADTDIMKYDVWQ